MAILTNEGYIKITGFSYSFENNNTLVEQRIYATKEDRDIEKEMMSRINTVKEKLDLYIMNMADEIMELEKIAKLEIKEKNISNEEYLLSHPDIAEKVKLFENMRQENMTIQDKFPYEEINYDDLKYKEDWGKLGLTKDIFVKINIIRESKNNVAAKTFDISELYERLKNNINGSVIDC